MCCGGTCGGTSGDVWTKAVDICGGKDKLPDRVALTAFAEVIYDIPSGYIHILPLSIIMLL